MARIRTVKPEHWADKCLSTISLQAHLLWIGTWNFSDDKGVFENDPLLLKSQIFPRRTDIRTEQIASWLDQLVKARYVIPFEYQGQGYYINRTFETHQRIDKPQRSKIPDSILGTLLERSENDPRSFPLERRGEESKVKGEEGIRPTPDYPIEIDDNKVGRAIEYLTLTKHVKATRDLILSLWAVFKEKNFTGEKFYRDVGDIHAHFLNSLKYENIKPNGAVNPGANKNSRSANADAFFDQAKARYDAVATGAKDI